MPRRVTESAAAVLCRRRVAPAAQSTSAVTVESLAGATRCARAINRRTLSGAPDLAAMRASARSANAAALPSPSESANASARSISASAAGPSQRCRCVRPEPSRAQVRHGPALEPASRAIAAKRSSAALWWYSSRSSVARANWGAGFPGARRAFASHCRRSESPRPWSMAAVIAATCSRGVGSVAAVFCGVSSCAARMWGIARSAIAADVRHRDLAMECLRLGGKGPTTTSCEGRAVGARFGGWGRPRAPGRIGQVLRLAA